ncbi:MAG: hypothetical protein HFE63_02960 [Clostridiales bacterium]|nr:hypothetical protein [Clostridiales bacterium]
MSRGYLAEDYRITETGVKFTCNNEMRQRVFDRCEELAKLNIKQFGDRKVMQEGAKYHGVWLETQPMGGEMYATHNMEVALNNQLIFMQYQRRDGRMPGMVQYSGNGMQVSQDFMQGDFFTVSALRMYWFIGKDKQYLKLLYESLRDFDEYLWNYRDSDGDGCLETWCTYDTGDDNNTRLLANEIYSTQYGMWCGEKPPVGRGKLPFESAEYMAYSYSHRIALAEISDILENGEGDKWRAAAADIRKKVREYLWDDEKKALFDRDCDNKMLYTLTLENLKCMYHGLMDQDMADDFIKFHLLNKDEFFTPLPLPNLAANDPLFYVNDAYNNFTPEIAEKVHKYMHGDILDNSWSGPVEGLSVQRSVDALLGYGHHAEASMIGRKWLDNLAKHDKYVQQYNPATGEPSPGEDGYGPTILAALEYITYLYGIDYVKDELIFSCSAESFDSSYEQTLFGHTYMLKRENGMARVYKDGREMFGLTVGARVVTDLDCNIKSISGMECKPVDITLQAADTLCSAQLNPNQRYRFDSGLIDEVQVRFDFVDENDIII